MNSPVKVGSGRKRTGGNKTNSGKATSQTRGSSTAGGSSQASKTATSDGPTETGNPSSTAATTGGSTITSGPSASRSTARVTGSRNSTRTSAIDPRLPPGGVAMVTPNIIFGAQYYKVGDFLTFAWNYTSLSVTPSGVDVLASCATNSQMYTLAMNQSVEATGSVTWDTGASQTVPFLTGTYTLIIHDAAKDVTASPQAGLLGTFSQFTFGMYIPQAYVPLNGK